MFKSRSDGWTPLDQNKEWGFHRERERENNNNLSMITQKYLKHAQLI